MTSLEPLPLTTAPPKERVAYLDNARYWVMLLVVIGHVLTQFTEMDSARGVYVWIYSFHMPFFVLISGYTARNYVGDARQVRRIVSTLVVPYLIAETSLQLITRHYVGEPDPLMILSPQWLAWFLAALFIWRLTTPIWRALRYPITTSIIISLAVGLIEVPNVLALPKVLGFLPVLRRRHAHEPRGLRPTGATRRSASPQSRSSARPGRLLRLLPQLDHRLVAVEAALRREPAARDGPRRHHPAGRAARHRLRPDVRSACHSCRAASRGRRRFGGRTFYCYLLHGYVILLLDLQFDVFDKIDQYGVNAVIVCIIGAVRSWPTC